MKKLLVVPLVAAFLLAANTASADGYYRDRSQSQDYKNSCEPKKRDCYVRDCDNRDHYNTYGQHMDYMHSYYGTSYGYSEHPYDSYGSYSGGYGGYDSSYQPDGYPYGPAGVSGPFYNHLGPGHMSVNPYFYQIPGTGYRDYWPN